MIIQRTVADRLERSLLDTKTVTLLYGPRQAGKTTLIQQTTQDNKKAAYFLGDDLFVQDVWSKNEQSVLRRAVADSTILVVDEAQRIPNIGLSAKIVVDTMPVKLVLTGSSSFELANTVGEPLTGRTSTFFLYPLSWVELQEKYRTTRPEIALEELLTFGMYPRVHTLTTQEERIAYLVEYTNNYLTKDILMLADVRKPKKVIDLLTLLALQVGNEVRIMELAEKLELSKLTVERYLDVLEKMFVIVNLHGFSRNLRNEVTKTSKYYFVDVGVRNAILRNFSPLRVRTDVGALFENWFVIERMKQYANAGKTANFYFWRTYEQQEIDLIEECDGALTAYECKWSEKKSPAAPSGWEHAYPEARFVPVCGTGVFELLEKVEGRE